MESVTDEEFDAIIGGEPPSKAVIVRPAGYPADVPKYVMDNLLSPREARFVIEFLNDMNGTRAILRCGFTKSYDCARAMAVDYRKRPLVNKAIYEGAVQSGFSQARVLSELANLAHYDPVVHHDAEGNLVANKDLSQEQLRAVKKVRTRTTYRTDSAGNEVKEVDQDVEFADKQAALSKLAQILKMEPQKNAEGPAVAIQINVPQRDIGL